MIALLLILTISQTEDEPGGARLAPDSETETATATPPAEEVLQPTGCSKIADQYYQQGFDDLVGGDNESAYSLFTQVMELCPKHPFAAEMARLALAIPPRKTRLSIDDKTTPKPAVALTGFEPEKPSLLARGELVAFQSVHGLIDGLLVCAAMECDDARAIVGLGFVGTAALGGLSFALSDGITSGQALAINSGTGWGAWHAGLILGVLEPNDDEVFPALITALSLAGTGLGTLIAVQGRPLNGTVSFTNSSGIWAGVLALFAMNIAEVDPFDDQEFWIGQFIATDVGLVAGALVARNFDISRGRTLLIDAGGVGGMLLGIGVAVLAEGEPEQSLVGAMGLIGTAVGLSSVFYLSRNIDLPDESVAEVMILPGGPRGSVGGTLAVAF